MKKGIILHGKAKRNTALCILFIGALLLVYMIVVEQELGALPLVLIITGALWFVFENRKVKK